MKIIRFSLFIGVAKSKIKRYITKEICDQSRGGQSTMVDVDSHLTYLSRLSPKKGSTFDVTINFKTTKNNKIRIFQDKN